MRTFATADSSPSGETFEELVERYRRDHPGTDTATAMSRVAAKHPELANATRAALPVTHPILSERQPMTPVREPESVVKFDALVSQYREKHPTHDYATAIAKVAKDHPDLSRQRNTDSAIPVGPGGVPMNAVPTTTVEASAARQFDAAVDQYRQLHQCDYATALLEISRQQPDLAAKRNAAITLGLV